MSRVCVVGAGLSGLAAAFYLAEGGADVLLLDAGDEPGGNLSSRKISNDADNWVLDMGPNSFGEKSEDLMSLVRACGADEDLVPASKTAAGARFLYRKGKVMPVPAGPGLMLSPILPLKDRLRLLKEPFVKPSSADQPEETLARFCDRRLGKMARLKLLTPVVSGIYAGDPERLGAESAFPKMVEMERGFGSLVRAAMKGNGPPSRGRLQTFKDGLQGLAFRLIDKLGDRYRPRQRVSHIATGPQGWELTTEQGDSFSAEHLVLAITAKEAAPLMRDADAAMASELDSIRYAPMSVVHVGVQREHSGDMPDGFGFLIPRDEGLRILGCIFSSKLFTGRAPEGHELVTIFIGGDLDPGSASLSDDELVDIALKDLRKALGGEWKPALTSVTRWPLAIPQYETGHKDRVARIDRLAAAHQGLYLLGNWRGGIAIPDCAREGKLAADRILASLK